MRPLRIRQLLDYKIVFSRLLIMLSRNTTESESMMFLSRLPLLGQGLAASTSA